MQYFKEIKYVLLNQYQSLHSNGLSGESRRWAASLASLPDETAPNLSPQISRLSPGKAVSQSNIFYFYGTSYLLQVCRYSTGASAASLINRDPFPALPTLAAIAGHSMKPSSSLASAVSGIVVRSQKQWHMVVLSFLNPEGQLNIRPKRLSLAIVPLSIKLQTPHCRAILLILVAALIDNRPHLNAKLVLPLRDAAVGVGDAGEGVRDGSELLVGRRETGQRDFYGGAGAADDGVEDVARDWGFGGGHCKWDLQQRPRLAGSRFVG